MSSFCSLIFVCGVRRSYSGQFVSEKPFLAVTLISDYILKTAVMCVPTERICPVLEKPSSGIISVEKKLEIWFLEKEYGVQP
jgi:hypothetical protein